MRKWTIRQFEWYRDNNRFYYRLKPLGLGRFSFYQKVWQTVIDTEFSLLTITESWQMRSVKAK